MRERKCARKEEAVESVEGERERENEKEQTQTNKL